MPWLVQDSSDDVRAVAAEALLPLAHALAAEPPQALQHILWDILLEVEELSPSTGRLAGLALHLCLPCSARDNTCTWQLTFGCKLLYVDAGDKCGDQKQSVCFLNDTLMYFTSFRPNTHFVQT